MRKRLGEILVEKGHLTQAQVEEALQFQLRKPNSKRIGEILIAHGLATREQVEQSLRAQQKRKGL